MLKIEDIRKDAALHGIEPGQVVRVVTTEPLGPDAVTVYYKTADGRVQERMLFGSDEPHLSLAEGGRPWAFDAPGAEFKLGVEAYRINLAYLFDPMMAVHTSNVDPLSQFTNRCCTGNPCASCWPTIPVPVKPPLSSFKA